MTKEFVPRQEIADRIRRHQWGRLPYALAEIADAIQVPLEENRKRLRQVLRQQGWTKVDGKWRIADRPSGMR